jgi:poly-gamma-glutamate synthesis protein (capsule biosynthesis protein)
MYPVGVGATLTEARQPSWVTVRGRTFAFLGYSLAHSTAVFAGRDRPGVAPIVESWIRRDVVAARRRADVVVVSMHWGMEYVDHPPPSIRRMAHRIIDAGADVILGHHPHVPQGLEMYRGKLIAYSLGNLVFDQWSGWRDRSFVLACRFRGRTISGVEAWPIDRRPGIYPRPAGPAEARAIGNHLSAISVPLATDSASRDHLARLRRPPSTDPAPSPALVQTPDPTGTRSRLE